MSLINVNRSALYLKQQQTLPTPPDGFIETNSPLIIVPNFATVDTNRMNGAMNTKDTAVDTCRTATNFLASVNMRATGTTPLQTFPEYSELLKVSGFVEDVTTTDVAELRNATTNIPKGSAKVYMDGKEFNFTNTLVGSTEIVLEVGKYGVVNTTLSGYIDNATANDVANPTPQKNNNKPLLVSCADIVTLKNVTIPAYKIVFKTNPDITNIYTMGGAAGIKRDEITDYALTCEITFPVESATFGREAAMIEAAEIDKIKVIIGANSAGNSVDGESVVFIADTTKATTYSDSVNNALLQRTLTLRLYDALPTPALRILTGKTSTI